MVQHANFLLSYILIHCCDPWSSSSRFVVLSVPRRCLVHYAELRSIHVPSQYRSAWWSMALTATPNHEGILDEFKAQLKVYTATAVCGKPYVRVEKLKSWLQSPGPKVDESRPSNVTHLLHATYRHRTTPNLPVQPEDLTLPNEGCLLIFSVLLTIGCGDMIDTFIHNDKFDSHLPLLSEQVHSLFGPERKAPAAQFFKEQWRFCPARFDLHKTKEYPLTRVIPICRRNLIKEGGTAQLWHIDVYEEFVTPALRDVAKGSKFNLATDPEAPEWRYEFALKTFKEGNRGLYNNEEAAYRALTKHDGMVHDGMVRWLGAYSHEGPCGSSNTSSQESTQESGTTTHNLLLEFGQTDLEILFYEKLPPILPKEVEDFWASFFEVADAVYSIHYINIGTGTPWEQDFHGWHSDIKPDNILQVGGRFKLADPGFARFKKVDKARGERPPEDHILGGTATYGAPESHQGDHDKCNLPLPQAMDIWSLGCVFSEVATWVVLGHQGVKQFRMVRKLQMQDIVNGQMLDPSQRYSTQGLARGDYFHNGHEVLRGVTEWHDYLRKVLRPTDTMTARVLDLVDREMLLGRAKDRVKAGKLCSTLKAMLESNQAETQTPISSIVEAALLEIDRQARDRVAGEKRSEPSTKTTVHLPLPDDPADARKSKVLQTPLMTTSHRTSALSGRDLVPAVRVTDHNRESVSPGVYTEARDLHASPDALPTNATSYTSADPFQNGSPNGPQKPPTHKRMFPDASQQSPTPKAQRPKSP